MKYIDEYRDKTIAQQLVKEIEIVSKKNVRIMEVCGGHTMAIRKFGIHKILPPTIELLSGPGCPVCVTSSSFIDKAIAYCRMEGSIIATYGDLIKVPGTDSSLNKEKANGADIRIVYSTLEALKISKDNPSKNVIFLGIGFETTTPSTAIAVIEAKKQKLNNFYVLSSHKIMPPAMAALIDNGAQIDGYIGPGHVTTITGSDMYLPLVKDYGLSIVISGFEPIDILQSILMLVRQLESNQAGVVVQYTRAVSSTGNKKAQAIVAKAFEACDDKWRGVGLIPGSGLKLNKEHHEFDIEHINPLDIVDKPEPKGCLCGAILKGMAIPTECKLFKTTCTPENPVGACMVSSEGTCAAYYRY